MTMSIFPTETNILINYWLKWHKAWRVWVKNTFNKIMTGKWWLSHNERITSVLWSLIINTVPPQGWGGGVGGANKSIEQCGLCKKDCWLKYYPSSRATEALKHRSHYEPGWTVEMDPGTGRGGCGGGSEGARPFLYFYWELIAQQLWAALVSITLWPFNLFLCSLQMLSKKKDFLTHQTVHLTVLWQSSFLQKQLFLLDWLIIMEFTSLQ